MLDIHVRGRDSNDPHGAGRALNAASERVRRMNAMSSFRYRLLGRKEMSVLDFEVVPRDRIDLEARLAEPSATVILPAVPRARDVLAVERSFSEWTTGMIAHA